MKTIILAVIGLFIYQGAFAQEPPALNQETMDKIKAARIALITERLELSPDQAERFWPIYREFSEERRGLREQMRDIRFQSKKEGLTDSEGKQLMEKAYQLKQRELNVEKKYADRLMKVISAQQLVSLRSAEQDFNRMIMRKIEQRQNQRMQREQMRQRRDERFQDGQRR